RFARIILWFPFFVIAALPQWWIQAISVILLIGIAAISAFSFYELLVVRTVLHFHWSEALSATGRKILLQSLLFSLYSQIHQRFGWMVLSVQRPELAYTALFLTCALLLLVDRAFESRFAKTAELDCKALVEELFSYKIGSLIGAFLLGLGCMGCGSSLVNTPPTICLSTPQSLSLEQLIICSSVLLSQRVSNGRSEIYLHLCWRCLVGSLLVEH